MSSLIMSPVSWILITSNVLACSSTNDFKTDSISRENPVRKDFNALQQRSAAIHTDGTTPSVLSASNRRCCSEDDPSITNGSKNVSAGCRKSGTSKSSRFGTQLFKNRRTIANDMLLWDRGSVTAFRYMDGSVSKSWGATSKYFEPGGASR
ncbi:hypothetical protein B0O80DRAFT_454950 [Mortierella sp. GBAus27b]|nr:hypothetical protein B0O80DRAFT_454950 [Mortierella sp. GBAus27b]